MSPGRGGTVLGVLTLIASVLVPWGLWYSATPRKEVSYTYRAYAPVVQLNDSEFTNSEVENLLVTYRGEPVESVWISVIRIQNTGTAHIPREHFDGALSITYPPERTLFNATIAGRQPSDLEIVSEIRDNSVQIAPLLMNAGDSFDVQITTQGGWRPDSVSARIEGVKQLIERFPIDSGRPPVLWTERIVWVASIFVVALLYGMLGGLALAPESLRRKVGLSRWSFIAGATGTAVVGFFLGIAGSRYSLSSAWGFEAVVGMVVIMFVVLLGIRISKRIAERVAMRLYGGPVSKGL